MKMKKSTVLKKVDQKRSYLELMFKDCYTIWKSCKYTDDRQLYCNTYEQLMEMLEDLEKCRTIGMICAYNQASEKDIDRLKRIQENFGGGR